jgi:hypothetical protein
MNSTHAAWSAGRDASLPSNVTLVVELERGGIVLPVGRERDHGDSWNRVGS